MIEADLKHIKKRSTTTSKAIKHIAAWQKNHEKDNATQFKEISTLITKLPTEESITNTIISSIQKTVNGKIDDVKIHLTQQDKDIEALSNKIKPIDGARTWLRETGQIVIYIGTFSLSIGAVIEILKYIGVIK